MVTILEEKCMGCGSCVDICHESCMTLVNGTAQINYDFCSTCTQCIAICPNDALQWENFAPEPFNYKNIPSAEQIDEFLKQRHTIRYFKEEKPERKIIQDIIQYGAYAPTHSHDFRVIAVDDQLQLQKIDDIAYSYNKKIYKYLYKPKLMSLFIKLASTSHQKEYLKAKPKLEKSLKIGRGYYCLPPVFLFIVGLKRIPLSLESAQYILYTIDLVARSRGLGCRNLVGNQMFFNRSRSIRELLKIKKNEKIFATVGIGYPATQFRNKVQGRTLTFRWSS